MPRESLLTESKEATEARINKGFENWMALETTRFMVSLIPAGENKDALITLLRDGYKSGFHTGMGSMATGFLMEMINAEKSRQ